MYLLSDKEIIRAGDELKIEIQATNVNVAEQTVDMYCTMIFKVYMIEHQIIYVILYNNHKHRESTHL
ncbi:unnamed protein product [marine sediment metagenome]|uniref:Uncharacterized protein n=1 Tax=marine sediment metagenome TaxID=412755 RepID=X1IMC9_9ZZZZ